MQSILLSQYDDLIGSRFIGKQPKPDLTVRDLAAMMGTRLVVMAARLECTTELQKELHTALMDGLDHKIANIRDILDMKRSPDDEQRWLASSAMTSYFSYDEFALLDWVDVDTDTNEYKVNDGEWRFGRPTREKVSAEQLGSLTDLFKLVARETPFYVTAEHIY